MVQLSESSGETVSVGRLEHTDVHYLMRQEGRYSVVAVSQVGKRLPAHATALGKALLAVLDPAEVTGLFGRADSLVQLTNSTIRTVAKLQVDLGRVRDRGYAVEYGEVVPGGCCLATDIPGAEVFGARIAISISMPEPKFNEKHEQIASELLRCATDLREDVRARRDLGGNESLF